MNLKETKVGNASRKFSRGSQSCNEIGVEVGTFDDFPNFLRKGS
jgi:hypothetical protein